MNLKGTGYYVNEQFPQEISDRRRELLPKLHQAKREVRMRGYVMILNTVTVDQCVANSARMSRISFLYYNLILHIFNLTEQSYYVAIGMPVLAMGPAQIILFVTVMLIALMTMIICQMYRYQGVLWIAPVILMELNCLICVNWLLCALLTVDWAVTIKLVQ